MNYINALMYSIQVYCRDCPQCGASSWSPCKTASIRIGAPRERARACAARHTAAAVDPVDLDGNLEEEAAAYGVDPMQLFLMRRGGRPPSEVFLAALRGLHDRMRAHADDEAPS